MNTAVYGPEPTNFNPDRFIKDKTIEKSSSFRPFGGGISYCPGQYIARQEVNIFIALALHRFEIGLKGDQGLPVIDGGKPETGIMSPMRGEGVILTLRAVSKVP